MPILQTKDMESTLEVRWFVKGIPPVTVQRWFDRCQGKLLGSQTRKDWYACSQPDYLNKFAKLLDRQLNPEEINLKLRQENLELKLRQPKLGTYISTSSHIHAGKIEQWYKFAWQELEDPLFNNDLLNQLKWIGVHKERQQKILRGVKSELTHLKVNRQCWWSVAFEMTQNSVGREDNCFKKTVETCLTHADFELSATNSYGYSRWLLEFLVGVNRNSPLQVRIGL